MGHVVFHFLNLNLFEYPQATENGICDRFLKDYIFQLTDGKPQGKFCIAWACIQWEKKVKYFIKIWRKLCHIPCYWLIVNFFSHLLDAFVIYFLLLDTASETFSHRFTYGTLKYYALKSYPMA